MMNPLLGLLTLMMLGEEPATLSGASAAPPHRIQQLTVKAGPMTVKPGPTVAFDVRDIRMPSPEWRGKLNSQLEPIVRHEGVAVWAVDSQGLKSLLEACQADGRCNIVQAPPMIARVGDPVRMSSETAHRYVAHLKRVADGPPNEATRLAFQPDVDQVHDGVRVNLLSSQLKSGVLFARLEIDSNRLLAIHTAAYNETIKGDPKLVVEEPHPGKGPIHDRLHRNIGIMPAAIRSTIQVPEVDSRHVEGEWLIPSQGALLVSLGPRTTHEGLRKVFEERLICVTARLEPSVPSVTPRPKP